MRGWPTPARPIDPSTSHTPTGCPSIIPGGSEVLACHAAALAAGQAGYLDPTTGLFVLTAVTLLERRNCCGNGCRHCPYVGGPDVA